MSGSTNNRRKKKLVTICSKVNTEFSECYPKFTYSSTGSRDREQVQVIIPTFPDNLMLYEHFERSDSTRPNHLSFMFVGGNLDGSICHDLSEYSHVSSCDFHLSFVSVQALFEIVEQLPTCTHVGIFLTRENIDLSNVDLTLISRKPLKPIRCSSVTILRLCWEDKAGDATMSNVTNNPWPNRNRFTQILEFALYCFPNLKQVKMSLVNHDGIANVLTEFLKRKGLLATHAIVIEAESIKCELRKKPTVANLPPPPKSVVSILSPPILKPNPSHGEDPFGGCKDSKPEQRSSNLKRSDPLLDVSNCPATPKVPRLGNDDPGRLTSPTMPIQQDEVGSTRPIKLEETTESSEEEMVVIEPPKKNIPIYDLVSDEETDTDIFDNEMDSNCANKAPKFPDQAKSIDNLASCPTATATEVKPSSESLRKISSSYDAWEINSSDEEDKGSEPVINLARKVDFNPYEIKNCLSFIQEVEESIPIMDNGSEPVDFREGVHFERRKKLSRRRGHAEFQN